MTSLYNTLALDVAFCDICSNYTPQVFVVEENESGCEYCWDAYGEIH
jgi:hypothetical protein